MILDFLNHFDDYLVGHLDMHGLREKIQSLSTSPLRVLTFLPWLITLSRQIEWKAEVNSPWNSIDSVFKVFFDALSIPLTKKIPKNDGLLATCGTPLGSWDFCPRDHIRFLVFDRLFLPDSYLAMTAEFIVFMCDGSWLVFVISSWTGNLSCLTNQLILSINSFLQFSHFQDLRS